MTRCWNDVSLGKCSVRSRSQIARPCESPPECAWCVAALASCQSANSPQTSAVSIAAADTNRDQRGDSTRPAASRAATATTSNRAALIDALCTSRRSHDITATIVPLTATKSALSATDNALFVAVNGSGQRGEGHRGDRAAARSVLQADRAAVLIDHLLDDGQPQARSGQGPRLIRPVEPVEYERQGLGGHAGTAVDNGQRAGLRQVDVDVRTGRAELARVVEHVGHRTVEAGRHAAHLDGLDKSVERDSRPVPPRPVNGALNELVEREVVVEPRRP